MILSEIHGMDNNLVVLLRRTGGPRVKYPKLFVKKKKRCDLAIRELCTYYLLTQIQ